MKIFPETTLIALPVGGRDAIKRAAGRYRITSTDYIRECIAARLEQDGIDVPELLAERRAHLPTSNPNPKALRCTPPR